MFTFFYYLVNLQQERQGTNYVIQLRVTAPAAFTPKKYSWYSFLLEAESTPGP
jgi:hypothetical protein